MHPGDVLLVKTDHFASKLIRFGQRGYGPEAAQWNHAALYVGEGQIVEALTKGVVASPADKYPEADVRRARVEGRYHPQLARRVSADAPARLSADAELAMRANACIFARSCVGEKYGWATIACIALKALFKGRWNFGVQGTSICSGLAARSLERLGYDFNPWDPAELTPAYLARQLGEQ